MTGASRRRTFVTGGAGFIGGELVDALLSNGEEVVVFDNLSTAEPDWVDRHAGNDARLAFVHGDVTDPVAVDSALAGNDRVVHLAASTDIAGGYGHPQRDFDGCVVGTQVVCEAMRRQGIREFWFGSSGVVYGGASRTPKAEGDGPYLPESHYAAGKLAGEAIVSGFAHLYGWRAFAFRFGNTVGARSNHGVVHDFVVKLLRDPRHLEILGDGEQAKPYVGVGDLVAGMRHAADHAPARPLTILNVGSPGTLSVRRVAELVIEALGLRRGSVHLRFEGAAAGRGGWPGDTPYVEFDTSTLRGLGWRPRLSPEDAVRDAADGIARRYRLRGRPLLTAFERRSGRPAPAGAGPG